ncbi:Lysoplasmalogenase [Aphelenchoides fujianensis]|nr:Lysoplasmalogenase [Aphelenchoides fujianensis]
MTIVVVGALGVYAALIGLFHLQTDGFEQRNVLPYCTMQAAPIISLAFVAYLGLSFFADALRTRCALGLLCSGIGDFLLSTTDLGFYFGTVFFALGHLFYISYFAVFLRQVSAMVAVSTFVYAMAVNHLFIVPFHRHVPLRMCTLYAYTLVIGAADVVAGSLYLNGSIFGQSGDEFRCLCLGYLIFSASDTLVLFEHLNFRVPYRRSIILLTYYAAQFLIFHNAHSAAQIEVVE